MEVLGAALLVKQVLLRMLWAKRAMRLAGTQKERQNSQSFKRATKTNKSQKSDKALPVCALKGMEFKGQ